MLQFHTAFNRTYQSLYRAATTFSGQMEAVARHIEIASYTNGRLKAIVSACRPVQHRLWLGVIGDLLSTSSITDLSTETSSEYSNMSVWLRNPKNLERLLTLGTPKAVQLHRLSTALLDIENRLDQVITTNRKEISAIREILPEHHLNYLRARDVSLRELNSLHRDTISEHGAYNNQLQDRTTGLLPGRVFWGTEAARVAENLINTQREGLTQINEICEHVNTEARIFDDALSTATSVHERRGAHDVVDFLRNEPQAESLTTEIQQTFGVLSQHGVSDNVLGAIRRQAMNGLPGPAPEAPQSFKNTQANYHRRTAFQRFTSAMFAIVAAKNIIQALYPLLF
jgi:hypothetical protein